MTLIKIKEVRQQTDLFSPPSRTIHFVVYNMKGKTLREADILPENAARWKSTTIRKELLFIISKMIKARKYAYQSYEADAPQDKWQAVLDLEKKMIMISSFRKLEPSIRYIKKNMLYLLEFCTPNKESRFYQNYKMQIDELKAYLDAHILNYQRVKDLSEAVPK
jgi:hypothetical protein